MRRRAFIAGLGGAAAWLIAARAQQSAKPPTIGFLGIGTLTAQGLWLAAFLNGCTNSAGSRVATS